LLVQRFLNRKLGIHWSFDLPRDLRILIIVDKLIEKIDVLRISQVSRWLLKILLLWSRLFLSKEMGRYLFKLGFNGRTVLKWKGRHLGVKVVHLY
jgi:hypothetical protein